MAFLCNGATVYSVQCRNRESGVNMLIASSVVICILMWDITLCFVCTFKRYEPPNTTINYCFWRTVPLNCSLSDLHIKAAEVQTAGTGNTRIHILVEFLPGHKTSRILESPCCVYSHNLTFDPSDRFRETRYWHEAIRGQASFELPTSVLRNRRMCELVGFTSLDSTVT
jgi:hypothetical protein